MSKVGMKAKQRRFEAHVLKNHKREALTEQGGKRSWATPIPTGERR